ncbi:hypothetical protein KO494_08410 [Lacinutrix sp. C3R15]|uniref:hypothetical protein n=1 Tax=Flavobacteriaceae TaxID=49546 RepID=UPI001C089B6A|nr:MULTISPECIES: hypothetical protein [Flavobacteriaceae]MBU2939562.1 hypothetical protein [Lacinutrix sp. C3R15]MDO6622876.1 hypothetical protein [Oceanihabitans sp. 1_MG-2023]
MTGAFTICANNYLAHAKTLAVSFKKHHPDKKFIIAILDAPNDTIDYTDLGADEVLWLPNLLSELIDTLQAQYGIAELCTVVKPELFKYFFHKDYEKVLYIDPDIKVFSPFVEVFAALEANQMVLTPHICSPTGEVGHPLDKDLMRTGIYNLGFLAVNNTPEVLRFVDWWDKRVKAYGYHDLKKGYFYDQIWLGYGPAFLDNVYVLRHLGYNVANWNLHERQIIKQVDSFAVNNEKTPLRFFHYSHYKMENEPQIASYNKNFNLDNRLDIVPVFDLYKRCLLANNYQGLKKVNFIYGKQPVLKTTSLQPKANRLKRAYKAFKQVLKILLGK